MIFTVLWQPTAEDSPEVWLIAPDKQAVTDAANQIDAWLRSDPDQRGDPFGAQRRVLMVPPLGVIFEISEADRIVRVLMVWYIPRHTGNGEP